jgi:hypothetical protein
MLAPLLLAPLATLRAADGPPRPNVLFLFADDQRADTIAALGNSVIKTPNLDRLVKRGDTFDRAYMQGGLQGATCAPSRVGPARETDVFAGGVSGVDPCPGAGLH